MGAQRQPAAAGSSIAQSNQCLLPPCPCRFEEWGPSIKQRLDPEKETVVLCHHGVRSMQVRVWVGLLS